MNENTIMQWSGIKVVIFDVDGTLYTQSRLRKKMMKALLAYYSVRPWKLNEMRILQHFRSEREKKHGYSGSNLENAQYEWCAEKGNYPISKIREVVEHWMFNFPNKYLLSCTYPGTSSFFKALKSKGFKIAIYSDYKADDKLKAMELSADLVVASTDPHIDRLKPDPRGLIYIAEKLGVKPEECLFIGDREELDGRCAVNAGMPYLILDRKPFDSFDFYAKLEKEISKQPSRIWDEPIIPQIS